MMTLRDALFAAGSLPPGQGRDLMQAAIRLRLAELDVEEALEGVAAAQAAVRLRQIQYGVGR